MTRKILISVCGGHAAPETVRAAAYELGKEIALRGYALITGGGGGVMEAASRGAAESGGLVIGILPNERNNPREGYPNPYVHVPIYTGLSDARNAVIAKAPDVLVALGGGPGTLSEIGLALKSGTPVIILKTATAIADYPGIFLAESVSDAILKIEEILGTGPQ